MNDEFDVFVELLDEGVETWRPTKAIPLPNGLFQLLPPPNYDQEDEFWEFLPGSEVRLERETYYTGASGLLAKHPNPAAVKVFVASKEKWAPEIRQTHALPLSNGLYTLLPTPHYTESQLWEFSPGSTVRLAALEVHKETRKNFPEYRPLLAVAP